jgi:hypothetical protein
MGWPHELVSPPDVTNSTTQTAEEVMHLHSTYTRIDSSHCAFQILPREGGILLV